MTARLTELERYLQEWEPGSSVPVNRDMLLRLLALWRAAQELKDAIDTGDANLTHAKALEEALAALEQP